MPEETATGGRTTRLPPSDVQPLRVLGVPGTVVRRYEVADVVADAVATLSPDAVVAVPPHPNLAAQRLAHAVDRPVVSAHRGVRLRTVAGGHGDRVVLAAAGSPEQVPATPDGLAGDDDQVCVLTDALSLRVDPHERKTAVDGLRDYLEALPAAWRGPEVLHLSTTLRAEFMTSRAVSVTGGTTVPLVGVGTADQGLGAAVETTTHDLAVVDLYPNGAVTTETLAPDGFGLRGLAQVGQTRAERLREAGLTSVDEVRAASRSDLARVADVGQATARTIATAAEATATETVVRTSRESLPDGEPIYVDIETDGLAASVAWLVGVLDGNAENGSYYPFRQRSLGAPGDHLEAFLTWLAGTARNRPVVAWNGYGFDFDILAEQIRTHCPERVETWERRYTFDPLYWARNQTNAALPGRTNRLEHVAGALGWKGQTTGIDGETAARVYTRWRDRMTSTADPGAVTDPDWDRLESYCEDDVRALATVWEAIESAPAGSGSESTGRQGLLSDF